MRGKVRELLVGARAAAPIRKRGYSDYRDDSSPIIVSTCNLRALSVRKRNNNTLTRLHRRVESIQFVIAKNERHAD
jgi:hypothetical protein